MIDLQKKLILGLFIAFAVGWQDESAPKSEFRTVENAITTQIKKNAPAALAQSGYLGIHVAAENGHLTVADVAAESPAAKAGLQAGDVLVELAGESVGDAEQFREKVHAATPGESIKIVVTRNEKKLDLTAQVGAISHPMKLAERRAVLGVQLGEAVESGGAPISRITPGSPAEKAGLKRGDIIHKIDDTIIATGVQFSDSIAEKSPGDTVTLVYEREGKTETIKVTLGGDENADARAAGYFRGGNYWKKDVYRLAMIAVEFPDLKHNAKIGAKDWEEELYSKGTYSKKKSVTGQNVFGSLNDYYLEQSCGAFHIEGKVFDWVEVSKKRMEYSPGTSQREKNAFIQEAVDKLLARDGKEALKEFDGLLIVYAGDRPQANRGGLYWPHRSNANFGGKRWSYFIVPEGGARMTSISVIAHEFGHMVGLPDLYARPENPGSTGLGVWSVMSNQNGNGRPQHMDPWCKEQLGWLKPAVIDPTVKQKLILSPIEGSSKECFKVLVRRDGSEYFLLENRRKKVFDQDLPSEGLFIWRVVKGRPILEESHGVEGPSGPSVFLSAIPYPSTSNDSFTPYTLPSSRSQLGGGLPVHITNIKRASDGKITFYIGYDYD